MWIDDTSWLETLTENWIPEFLRPARAMERGGIPEIRRNKFHSCGLARLDRC